MELNEFLTKAKVSTYACVSEGGENKLDDGGRELVYKESGHRYRDRYFGSDPFIGEEVVWKDENVIWAMNYYGKMTTSTISTKEVYEFLKEAMRRVNMDRPFRGPEKFEKEYFSYSDKSFGTIDDFEGEEEIFYKGEKVYELKYHGGIMKKR